MISSGPRKKPGAFLKIHMKQTSKNSGKIGRFIKNLDASPKFRPRAALALMLLGLLLFTAAQSALSLVPLWTRASFTEVDDILGYICKTKQMEECFYQDCPALNDLREQLLSESPTKAAAKEKYLASTRVLPIYHFLLSGALILITKLGPDLFLAYKLLWSITPFLFGLAFLYLLSAVWGRTAAGLGLALLAFKVFPDTGLHLTVPSNLAMGLAAALWARIISRRGRAPLALTLGTLALITLHPAGRVYAVMGICFTLVLAKDRRSPALWGPVAGSVLLLLLSFLLSAVVKRPYLFNEPIFPPGHNPILFMIQGAAASIVEIVSNVVRLEEGLFGDWPIFYGALVLGFLSATAGRRKTALTITGIYLFFLTALLFYGPTQPADGFLRIWIPLVVVLFGGVGQALRRCLAGSWDLLVEKLGDGKVIHPPSRLWPVIALAVLMGYSMQMTSRGAEQILGMINYLHDRMPIALADSGPERLLDHAQPGDRVLYDSMIVMPFYLSRGALSLGAVYYHPAFQADAAAMKWLEAPNLHYAALYNPLVRHPAFRGRQEHNWWVSAPDLRYSPISARRTNSPMLKEGSLDSSEYHWIDVEPFLNEPARTLNLQIPAPTGRMDVELYGVDDKGIKSVTPLLVQEVPQGASGWIRMDLSGLDGTKKYRLIFDGKIRISGLTFNQSPFNWPWLSRTKMTLNFRTPQLNPVTVSFDPADLLPAPLDKEKIKVLDDQGSAVLMELDGGR